MSGVSPSLLQALRNELSEGRTPLFADYEYPTQLKDPPGSENNHGKSQSTYLGEARGFYPRSLKAGDDPIANGYFQPWNSFYHAGANKDGTHRRHKGVDIYAPYFPFPYEIPVRALVSGTIDNRTYRGDFAWENGKSVPGDLGNRITLSTSIKVAGKTHTFVFIYGHLNRFAMDDRNSLKGDKAGARPVEVGQIIGYIGHSGNADDRGSATTRKSPFSVSSAHLHLIAGWMKPWTDKNGKRRWSLVKFDPLEVLPKPLGYHPDIADLGLPGTASEKTTRTIAADWSDDQPKLKPKRPDPTVPKVILRSGSKSDLSRTKTETGGFRRAVLPRPFNQIDADRTSTLKATLAAYELMNNRRENWASKLQDAVGSWAAHIPAVDQDDQAGHDDRDYDEDRWSTSLWALSQRADTRFQALNFEKDAGHAAAATMHLHEALYVLLGGPAMEILGENGGARQVCCGIGMRGHVMGAALGGAVAAIHFTTLPTGKTAKGPVSSVASVTFGAGSIRHATFSWAKAGDEVDKDFRAKVWAAIGSVHAVTKTMRTLASRLTANDAMAKHRVRKKIVAARTAILRAGGAFGKLDDAGKKKALKHLLTGAIAHFEAAEYLSRQPDTPATRAAPRVYALYHRPNGR
jgi:murein DD-endopeptidase MepM/ murein hydrolase activator NlpD